jgi:hypothetical protein
MPKAAQIPIKDLSLDLSNFRTVRQRDENRALQAILAIKTDRFWALTESLLDDGYIATENIIVLRRGKQKIVKEGNRRIAALKLIHGLLPLKNLDIPDDIKKKIVGISTTWKKANQSVPSIIYEAKDEAIVDHIVTLTHGKGEKAGRDQWSAIARARHNRDISGVSEPALDILEKYLQIGQNVTVQEKEKWSGDYPITVFHEAIKRLAGRFNVADAPALAKKYPKILYRKALEKIIHDIGNNILKFDTIRDKTDDFGTLYGIPLIINTPNPTPTPIPGGIGNPPATPVQPVTTPPNSPVLPGVPVNPTPGKPPAIAINDPKSVTQALRKFVVLGNGRDKIESLRIEAININIKKNPMAFCFILRSMFELSAKAYCDDHATTNGPKYLFPNGNDRKLVDILNDVHAHLIQPPGATKKDAAMQRYLHGAIVELGKPDRIFSVTSMNHLIHNPNFSVAPSDISIMFGNIYPLLYVMNR